jgi:hypothetical protein
LPKSSPKLPSSGHCIHKGISVTSLHWLVIHPDIARKSPRRPLPPRVESGPRSAFLRLLSRDRPVLQLVTSKLVSYLTQRPCRLSRRQLFSSSSPTGFLPRDKQQSSSSVALARKPRSYVHLARIADSPPKPRQAVSHRIVASQLRALCPSFLQCLQDIGLGPSTQSSDVHTIHFCHLTKLSRPGIAHYLTRSDRPLACAFDAPSHP